MKKHELEVYGITDVGTVKKVNEDGFVYKVVDAGECYSGIFAIADGVGGLSKGEIASSIAISNINKWWENEFKTHYNDKDYLVHTLLENIKTTNNEISNYALANGIRMATTLTILFIYKDEGIIVNIGDSRVYCYSNGIFKSNLVQLTVDHSCVVQKEIDGKMVDKSFLTEWLGNKPIINYFTTIVPIHKGDIFILCSDGIYKTMKNSSLLSVIKAKKNNLQQLCSELINSVKLKKETDNISVITVRIK